MSGDEKSFRQESGMKIHRIRLRGPWQYDWEPELTESSDASVVESVADRSQVCTQSGTAKLPANWQSLFGEVSGRARFRRRFHKPTHLETSEQVVLIFEQLGGNANVKLNNKRLGSIPNSEQTAEFDISRLMEPMNQIELELTVDVKSTPASHAGLWNPVILEIRDPNR